MLMDFGVVGLKEGWELVGLGLITDGELHENIEVH